MGGGVNRLSPYLWSNTVERESQETHKREKGEWKQSQVQDNDKVKCALNGSAQSQRDKGRPADKVCAAEGNGRSGKALGIGLPSTCTPSPASTQSAGTPALQHHLLDGRANAAVQREPQQLR